MTRPTTTNGCCKEDESSIESAALQKLIHPNFFAGQLLTDRDLKDLLKYVKDRFALLRFRDGWGVVCGMLARANENPEKPLTVTSGYAVDCSGRDLVLDCDQEVPLPPHKRGTSKCPPISSVSGVNPERVDFPGPGTIPKKNLGVFDITACFAFEDFDPAIVLSECKRQCKDSRRKEGVTIHAKPVDLETLDERGTGPNFGVWRDVLDLLESLKKRLGDRHFYDVALPPLGSVAKPIAETPANVCEWLTKQMDDNPRFHQVYPHLREWWEKEEQKPYNTPWKIAALLAWLIGALRDPSRDSAEICPEPICVPLGRIWAEWTGVAWKIRYVDQIPPWRKNFDSCQNKNSLAITHFLGLPWWEVRLKLAQFGIELFLEWEEPHLDPAELGDKYREDFDLQMLMPKDKVVAVVTPWTDRLHRNSGRVIRFRKLSAPEELFEGTERLRMPITKRGARIDVTFHEPAQKTIRPPEFRKPADKLIEPDKLEVGMVLEVAVSLNAHFDARTQSKNAGPARIWNVLVYDELFPDSDGKSRQVRPVRGNYVEGAVIVWTVEITPKLRGKQSLEFAVLIQEDVAGETRHAAVWKPVEITVYGRKPDTKPKVAEQPASPNPPAEGAENDPETAGGNS